MQLEPKNLEKYAQVVSKEMMHVLKESAYKRGVSLDIEIALRLAAMLDAPNLDEDNSLLNQIKHRKFTKQEKEAERQRTYEANLFLFEVEKLRHIVGYKRFLPPGYTENFSLINVKEWTLIIKAEQAAERKRNKGKGDNGETD